MDWFYPGRFMSILICVAKDERIDEETRGEGEGVLVDPVPLQGHEVAQEAGTGRKGEVVMALCHNGRLDGGIQHAKMLGLRDLCQLVIVINWALCF